MVGNQGDDPSTPSAQGCSHAPYKAGQEPGGDPHVLSHPVSPSPSATPTGGLGAALASLPVLGGLCGPACRGAGFLLSFVAERGGGTKAPRESPGSSQSPPGGHTLLTPCLLDNRGQHPGSTGTPSTSPGSVCKHEGLGGNLSFQFKGPKAVFPAGSWNPHMLQAPRTGSFVSRLFGITVTWPISPPTLVSALCAAEVGERPVR